MKRTKKKREKEERKEYFEQGSGVRALIGILVQALLEEVVKLRRPLGALPEGWYSLCCDQEKCL